MEKIKPLGLQVLVEPALAEEKTASGIIVPEQVREKEKPNRGVVVAIGEKVENVKPGDTVLFGKYAGTEMQTQEKKYLIMKYQDLFAVIQS